MVDFKSSIRSRYLTSKGADKHNFDMLICMQKHFCSRISEQSIARIRGTVLGADDTHLLHKGNYDCLAPV